MVFADKLDLCVGRLGWNSAVHVVLKKRLEFRAALFEPLVARSNPPAIEHHQRIGQGGLGLEGGRVGE